MCLNGHFNLLEPAIGILVSPLSPGSVETLSSPLTLNGQGIQSQHGHGGTGGTMLPAPVLLSAHVVVLCLVHTTTLPAGHTLLLHPEMLARINAAMTATYPMPPSCSPLGVRHARSQVRCLLGSGSPPGPFNCLEYGSSRQASVPDPKCQQLVAQLRVSWSIFGSCLGGAGFNLS